MQSRGTAHFHSAIHVQNAPLIDRNTDEEIVLFVDKYISCSIPSEEEDASLKDLVTSRQIHHHTRTCKKKKGLNCRFHFPKPPAENTIVCRQPVGELAKRELQQARTILNAVMETLEQTGTDISLSDLLQTANVSSQQYTFAVKTSLKRTSIILKRTPSETNVNPYNPIILKALRANMDIQYITDVWACVAYITSYMCKPERTMSDLMRNACKEADSVRGKLKSVGNTLLKCREVSQHEAVARLIGLPLRETKTPVMYVPTGYSSQRTRLLKPSHQLMHMNKEDTDIFLPNILDKYSRRPDELENECLAYFASNYIPGQRTTNTEENVEEVEDDDTNVTSKVIKLKDGLGTMRKRKKPIVLRDYPVSREKDSEKYYHRLLILYLPWRSETELKNQGSFEQKYIDHNDSIYDTVQQYEPYLEEVADAAVVCDADNCDEEIWDRLAPQAEQSREEDTVDDPDFQTLDTDILSTEQLEHNTDIQVQTKSQHQRSLSSHINIEPQEQYLTMIRSLNLKQRQIHDHIFKWCRHLNLASSKLEEPQPFYIFLSGGAGVGKSHVVHAIYQTAVRNLRKAGNSADTPTVLLTAPTGKAAVNIGGTTLHSAFHLPVKMRGERFAYKPPATSHLNTLRALYCNMKILIIDEISMVGARTFSHLNLTLQEIFENEQTFGGISVLAVGDLLQLHPVGEKPVYCNEQKGYEALSTSVWDLFLLFELTEVLRQKGDPEFAKLLSRIREGKHTSADLQTLEHLQDNNISDSCISVFLTNALKDDYNSQQLRKLSTQVYTIKSNDSKKDLKTRRIPVTVTSTNIHETGGLAYEIEVAVNARYMHTKNTDIAEGLVNGATCTIKQVEIPSSNPLSGTLYIQFDDKNTGKQLKLTSKYKGLVPIKAVSAVFSITEKSTNVHVERTQFPGTLAWGITVHKSQGSTYHEMIADMTLSKQQKTTMPGQIYTMLSRAKSMDGIKLISFRPSKILVNRSALEEMSRLRIHKQLTFDDSVHLDQDNYNTLAVTFLNIRSLKAHHEDLLRETSVKNSQVICLCETKLKNYTRYEIEGTVCNSLNTKHGSVIYACSSIERKEIIIAAKLDSIEAMAVKVKSVSIVSVYIPPTTSLTIVKNDFQSLLQELKPSSQNTCVILGDFNLDNNKRQRLETLAEEFGLKQLVHEPTHELGAVLDLAFTNLPNNVCTTANSPVCYSDHHAITIRLKLGINN